MGDTIDNENNIKHNDKKPDLNRSFSNNNNADIRDFQSENMIHKLKKIKKKKMKNNYKKVKELDILTNDIPLPTDNDNTINHKPSTATFQYIKNLIFNRDKPIIEKFEEDDYEGIEKPRNTKSRQLINKTPEDGNIISRIYKYINFYNTYLAELLVGENETYNKKSEAREKDIKLVRNSIVWLECAFISSIMVYNWYFAIYFAKDKGIHIPSFSADSLIEWGTNPETTEENAFITIFLWFFEFALWFPEKLNWLLVDILPKTSGILNGTCNFLFLYFVCLYCTKYFAISFKNFFDEIFNMVSLQKFPTHPILWSMLLIIIGLFICSLMKKTIAADQLQRFAESMSGGILYMVLKGIYHFIHLIIILIFCIPAGAIGSGLYLIYMSFFSRVTWGNWKVNDVLFGMTSITDIDNHVRSSKAGFEETDLCNSDTLFTFLYSVLSIIFNFLDYFKEHLLKIIYTIMLAIITISISINMSSVAPNKLPLNFFAAITSLACIVMVITSVIRYYELNKPTNNDSL
jgi:hypothetical protein